MFNVLARGASFERDKIKPQIDRMKGVSVYSVADNVGVHVDVIDKNVPMDAE
ncbi:hypothetical protein KIPB_015732, partial [Kipferlia bialata]|eukprot:g15732.t1